MKVLLTDVEQPNTDLEQSLLSDAGFEMVQGQCRTPQDVIQVGQEATALVAQLVSIPREVFEGLPNLRIITTVGIGVDTIDLEAAKAHGVWVANVPDGNINEVATHALAMALAMIRHLPFFDRSVREGQWHYEATGPLRRPNTLTLGIVGLGNIGRMFAQLAQPCFKRLLAYDPYLPGSIWPDTIERVELAELFRQSDVVSLHIPLTEETHHLVAEQLLSQMSPGSYLVNASRGALVDLDALLHKLDNGHLAGAALDVLPQEPPPPGHPVLLHPRVSLSPHAAFYSVESEEELRRKAILNIINWAQNGRPPYVVVEGRDDR